MNRNYLMELANHLELEYGFSVCEITPAKRGVFGETWKLQTDNATYFVKIDYWDYHKQSYKKSLSVIEYITGNGITFVPKIIKTKTEELSCCFHQGIVSVSEYVEGENNENYPIEELFSHLARIYQLNSNIVDLTAENFGLEVLTKFHTLLNAVSLPSKIKRSIYEKEVMISKYAKHLKQISHICRNDVSDFYITHGDAGGNCILHKEQFFIIDWDSVKLAPIERDAWFFVCDNRQIDVINEVLQRQHLNYELKIERLCYYCYYSFFYYLTEYLDSFLCAENEKLKKSIAENLIGYLTQNWIYKRLDTADRYGGLFQRYLLNNQKNAFDMHSIKRHDYRGR